MGILRQPSVRSGRTSMRAEGTPSRSCSHLHIYVENGLVVEWGSTGPGDWMSEIELCFLTVKSNPESLFTREFLWAPHINICIYFCICVNESLSLSLNVCVLKTMHSYRYLWLHPGAFLFSLLSICVTPVSDSERSGSRYPHYLYLFDKPSCMSPKFCDCCCPPPHCAGALIIPTQTPASPTGCASAAASSPPQPPA